MIWTLDIPGWHPAPLNELVGNRGKAQRLKAKDRDIVGRAVLGYRVAKAGGPRRVSLMVVYPAGKRMHDPDSLWKSLLDALVATGALAGDTFRLCQCETPEFVRGATQRTIVTIEDLP